MTIQAIALSAFFCASLMGADTRLSPRFQTVYIVEMSNALNQHIANRLTSANVMWVVHEPGSADAVLTYTIDDSFWDWLAQTYSPPASGSTQKGDRKTEGDRKTAYRPDPGGTERYRGNVFLVDPRSRMILWSTYQLPKNTSSNELDRTAARIAQQLKTALGKK